MGHIDVVSDEEFDEPVIVEGLPGIGLVGKIVADHLVESLDMVRYADVHCDALPAAAAYAADERAVRTPITSTPRPATICSSSSRTCRSRRTPPRSSPTASRTGSAGRR